MINGLWYKVWHFQGTDMSGGIDLDYHVIEGIGCTNGLIFAIQPYRFFEYSEQLFCFTNRGTSYSLSVPVPSWGLLGDVYFDNASSCGLPLSANEITASHIVVNPNPATASITINSGDKIFSVAIYSLEGKLLQKSEYNSDSVKLDVSNLQTGMYLIRINGTEVRRFVKQ